MNKTRHLTFRCTEAEYQLIKQICGKNLSRFIVSRLFKGIAEMDFNKESGGSPLYLSPEERRNLEHELSKYRLAMLNKEHPNIYGDQSQAEKNQILAPPMVRFRPKT